MGLPLIACYRIEKRTGVEALRVAEIFEQWTALMSYVNYAMERDSDGDPMGYGAQAEMEAWETKLTESERKVTDYFLGAYLKIEVARIQVERSQANQGSVAVWRASR